MFIKALTELEGNSIDLAGGKGANLGTLIKHGFPVPPGFCITTAGYLAFTEVNNLQSRITSLLSTIKEDDPGALEKISNEIRHLFTGGVLPDALEKEIRAAYRNFGPVFYAVRSSATAEDLPEMSFAGQQDTYLNIKGEEPLLDAVKRCWGSLWTARAIAYRSRNGIPHNRVALAVVIQQMVASESSGVLFTANPLTGKRSETAIDATLGLGEALVSGLVEPDNYLVDALQGRIIRKVIGKKALSIQGTENGGTVTRQETAAAIQALPDAQILELTQLGVRAARVFGCPQDMEWAWADSRLYIVQSRPVTSLYPLPAGVAPDELLALLSFGAVQGMLDPMTPLGREIFQLMATHIQRYFGKQVTLKNQHGLMDSGERLFLNFTPLFRSSFGRRGLLFFINFAEPGSKSTVERLFDDPRLAVKIRFMKLSTLLGFIRVLIPVLINVVLNLLFPTGRRLGIMRLIRKTEAWFTARYAALSDPAGRIRFLEKSIKKLPIFLFSKLVPLVACGQMPLQMLRRLFKPLSGGEELVMELTRGLPHNVTTEMDLKLWQTACLIKADAAAAGYIHRTSAADITAAYLQGALPHTAQESLDQFLKQYGMRGFAEIDMGRPRWKENPEPLIRTIQSYLDINDPSRSPEAVFRKSALLADAAGKQLLEKLTELKDGKRKKPVVRFFLKRVRELVGLRETPKFSAIRIITIHRDALLESGNGFVLEGLLANPDDVFFLHLEELKALAGGANQDWKALITQRREVYAREKLRRRIPRFLLTDGTAFYEGISTASKENPHIITGSPVSAGVTEGTAHVIFDPYKEQLLPGEILVCPGTDPAWTPLFLAASGLVMEVGGMMTHGSVVAREYGIPAVVGVDQATTRLKTGQRIRMDGSNGVIEILGES